MITAVDLNEDELKMIEKIREAEHIRTRSEVIRKGIIELHKKILSKKLSIDSVGAKDFQEKPARA